MTNQELSIQIAIGSQNQAKNRAVQAAFERAFPEAAIEASGFDVESGIANQPTTNEESVEGAINRAKGALAQLATARFGVGLEGNTVTIADRMYLLGWVAIVERDTGAIGIGHSSGVELPDHLRRGIENGQELGPMTQALLDDTDNIVRHTQGTGGILTGGLYTREQEFIDATTVALARFIRPELYIAK
jgi:inosine/xanthosine triphosphatase